MTKKLLFFKNVNDINEPSTNCFTANSYFCLSLLGIKSKGVFPSLK